MPVDSTNYSVDVVIIGGGPAGSALATYLAREKINCLIVEKSEFPRHHVGESLVLTCVPVLKELGVLEEMEDRGFVRKYGAACKRAGKKTTYKHDFKSYDSFNLNMNDCADISYSEDLPSSIDQEYSYHVDRSQFDLLLLENAKKRGARVIQPARVLDTDFSNREFVSIQIETKNETLNIRSNLVVDASGRDTFLGRKFALKKADPNFDQLAIYSWFEGYNKGEGKLSDYIFIHMLEESSTWIWQIPIDRNTTSIGVVTQKSRLKSSGLSPEDFFWSSIKSSPELTKGLNPEKQQFPFKIESDYSYSMSNVCGDRWILIGDAARFVDPIFSSGVSIALNSARTAAKDINKAFSVNKFTKNQFSNYSEKVKNSCQHWYTFISLYYRLNILFTHFVLHPNYRLDILRLLQGDVSSEKEPAVLEKMRSFIRVIESDPNHIWHEFLSEQTLERPRTD
jgi:FADH2 O2-dependent halogenase